MHIQVIIDKDGMIQEIVIAGEDADKVLKYVSKVLSRWWEKKNTTKKVCVCET